MSAKGRVFKKGILMHDFKLIESILWDGDYRLLDLHLKRLLSSAKFFGFACDCESLKNALLQNHLPFGFKFKVRLLLDSTGAISLQNHKLEDLPLQATVAISSFKTDSRDIFLYHKTTNRSLYNSEFKKASSQGLADVIFLNERDEVTEGAISNVFVLKNDRLYTPPVSCGLLPGVYRQYTLETCDNASEKVLKVDDLLSADKVFISNAIRGLREVRLQI